MRKVKPLLIGWGLHMAQLYFTVHIFYPNTHSHELSCVYRWVVYAPVMLFLAENIVFGH